MGTLCWDDVSDLSIFKCKICKCRLQYPVMEVQTFGYICGNCYDRSAYTNVSESTDIERILSKLCIPCKYSERGCYFDGSFQKTSEHEKQSCEFRDKICPFLLISDCDTTEIRDVVDHIKKEHEDYYINAVLEENCITIQDPMKMKCTETNPDTFYLFEFQKKPLLFQCKVDVKQQIYNYILYHFDDDEDSNDIAFYFTAKHQNLTTKSEEIHAINYAQIFNTQHNNILTLSAITIANLECEKQLRISLITRDVSATEIDNELQQYVCKACGHFVKSEAHVCSKCDTRTCNACYNINTTCKKCKNKLSGSLNLYTIAPNFQVRCELGCNQLFRKDEFELHKINCLFALHECFICWELSLYTNIYKHLLLKHKNNVYMNNMSISQNCNSKRDGAIIKNNIAIQCHYSLSSAGDFLNIRLGAIVPTHLDNSYTWELHMKNNKTSMSTVISGLVRNAGDENNNEIKIYVSDYVTTGKLHYDVYIKHRHMKK